MVASPTMVMELTGTSEVEGAFWVRTKVVLISPAVPVPVTVMVAVLLLDAFCPKVRRTRYGLPDVSTVTPVTQVAVVLAWMEEGDTPVTVSTDEPLVAAAFAVTLVADILLELVTLMEQ